MYAKNQITRLELDLSVERREYKFDIPGKQVLVDAPDNADVCIIFEGGTTVPLRYVSAIKTPGFRYFYISNAPSSGTLTLYITTCGAELDNTYVSYEQLKSLVSSITAKLIEATQNISEVVS